MPDPTMTTRADCRWDASIGLWTGVRKSLEKRCRHTITYNDNDTIKRNSNNRRTILSPSLFSVFLAARMIYSGREVFYVAGGTNVLRPLKVGRQKIGARQSCASSCLRLAKRFAVCCLTPWLRLQISNIQIHGLVFPCWSLVNTKGRAASP